MRTIKFRARSIEGDVVFGDLIHIEFKYQPSIRLFIVDNNGEHEIEPDSVAQLVGLDRNGDEVYERDELINPNSCVTFFASLIHIYAVGHFALSRSNP